MDSAFKRRMAIDIGLFTVASFALTWILVGAYIVAPDAAARLLGPLKLGAPAFYVAVYAPSLAAVAVTALRYGKDGLKDLLASLVRLRAPWVWVGVSVLGFPLLWLGVEWVRAAFEGRLASVDYTPWLVGLPMVILGGHLLRDPGALGEELGWRGFALPRLLMLFDARTSALALGFVWAIWHLPAFYVSSLSQSQLDLLPFIARVMAFSVFMAWLFVHTRGSVLWAGVVPHMLFNASPHAGIQLVGWIIVVAAIVILVFSGRHLRGWGAPPAELPQMAFLRSWGGRR